MHDKNTVIYKTGRSLQGNKKFGSRDTVEDNVERTVSLIRNPASANNPILGGLG